MRKNIATRKKFPNDEAVIKILFLNIRNFSNRWSRRQGWDSMATCLTLCFFSHSAKRSSSCVKVKISLRLFRLPFCPRSESGYTRRWSLCEYPNRRNGGRVVSCRLLCRKQWTPGKLSTFLHVLSALRQRRHSVVPRNISCWRPDHIHYRALRLQTVYGLKMLPASGSLPLSETVFIPRRRPSGEAFCFRLKYGALVANGVKSRWVK
jgi:hypothetical protein